MGQNKRIYSMKAKHFKLLPLFQTLALLSFIPEVYAAQNFLIQPNGPLPTEVSAGGSVTANFTVTNLTNLVRNGYSVVGLPSTVQQNASSGNCSAPINLAAHARCNLQFIINGAVNSKFAICKGSNCTTSSEPLNVTVTSSRMVAGGTYCSNAGCLPLLAQTTTGTWSYPSTVISNLPTSPGFGDATIRTASCSGPLCIAAGNDNNNNSTPFIAVSPSNGNNWTYPVGSSGTWPIDLTGNAQFKSSSCSGALCVVVGEYVGNGSQQYPIVAQTTDSGLTWAYPINSTTPPPNLFVLSRLNGASCSGSMCVAAGTYEDNTNAFYYALIEQTTNGGSNWNFAMDRFTGIYPNNYNGFAEFLSTSCSGSWCTASGNYHNGSTYVGMLAQTTNGGSTWTYAIDDTKTPALFAQNGTLYSTSCSGSLCVAGGTYIDSNSHQQPMLAQSTNGGVSWTFVIDASTGPQLQNYSAAAAFYSVSCSGNVCTAGGTYTDNSSNQVPMLAQTTNGGATWTYVIQDSNTPPDYTESGQFNTVSCSGNTCIAAGTYFFCGIQYPLLAQSIGGGAWTYVISTIANVPPNFTGSGVFYGSSAGANTWMKKLTLKKNYLNLTGCLKPKAMRK